MAVAITATMTAGGYYAYGQSDTDGTVDIVPTLRYDVGYGTIAHDLELTRVLLSTPSSLPDSSRLVHNAIGYNVTGSPWIAVFPDPLTTEEGGSLVASGDPIKPYDFNNGTRLAITCNTNDFGHDPTMLAEFDYIPGATYTGIDTFDIVIKEFTYTGNAGNATCTTTGATKTIPVEITVGEKPSVTFRDDFTKSSNSSGVVVLYETEDLYGKQPPNFLFPFPSFEPFVSNARVGLDLPETTDGGLPITLNEDQDGNLDNLSFLLYGTEYNIRGVFSDDFFLYNMTVGLPYGTVVDGAIVESQNEIARKMINVTLDASGADAPVCSASVSGDLDFGSLAYGDTSDAKLMVIENTGTAYIYVDISATDWMNSNDEPIMDVGQTRYGINSSNHVYENRTPMSETDGRAVDVFPPGNFAFQYLQVQIDNISQDFTGQLTQTITTTATCSI